MLRVHGFYGHVRLNDLRSAVMFLGFIVAFQVIGAVALALPLVFIDIGHAPFFPLAYGARYAPVVLALGVAAFALRFSRHVASVRATVGFAFVERRDCPRLVNIVETTAIAAGLPIPRVGLIETPARNAFACGLTASSAVVVVTRGLLESLDDDELAAVVAHEIAHIRNGDIRLMAAANVLMDSLLSLERKNILRISNWRRGLVAIVLPPYLFLAVIGGLVTNCALLLARLSRLLIASSREFVADAEAVRLTHNPEALISALRRIEGRSALAGLGPQADAMMIDGAVEGAYATHPTVGERISVLARLSNIDADASAPREAARASDPWSRAAPPLLRPQARPAAVPGRLLARVDAGIEGNLFGISPGARRIMVVGFVGLLCLQVWVMISVSKATARHEAKNAPAIERGVALRKEVTRLSALSPLEAGCFATERYSVSDRGSRPVRALKPELIEDYAFGRDRGSSDLALERYLGLRLRSVRAVERAAPAELDGARAEYVRIRKVVLEVVHRFFGEPGLQVAREAYDGPEDRAIVSALGETPGEGGLTGDVALLTASPGDFIPCVARARMAQAGQPKRDAPD